MAACDEFYLHRDRRSASYLGSVGLDPKPVAVSWGRDAAGTGWGQICVLALANLTARFARRAAFSGPNSALRVKNPFGGTSLAEAVMSTLRSVDPCGTWGQRVTGVESYKIGVGRDAAPSDHYVAPAGWVAHVQENPNDLPRSQDNSADALGASLCACLASANSFKRSLGLNQSLFDGALSLWSLRYADFDPGPPLPDSIDLGRVLVAGAGAVANSLVYWLQYSPIRAKWDVVDGDHVELHNTNRAMLFTPGDAGWPAGPSKPKAMTLARYLQNATPHKAWVDELIRMGDRWDLIVPLANERNARMWIQRTRPPLALHATTSENWWTQLFRHRPARDRCLICQFPDGDRPSPECATATVNPPASGPTIPADAALPFLSSGAGLMLLSDLLRLGMGQLASSRPSVVTWDWFGSIESPRVWKQECDPQCTEWSTAAVRKKVNASSKWYDLDQSATT